MGEQTCVESTIRCSGSGDSGLTPLALSHLYELLETFQRSSTTIVPCETPAAQLICPANLYPPQPNPPTSTEAIDRLRLGGGKKWEMVETKWEMASYWCVHENRSDSPRCPPGTRIRRRRLWNLEPFAGYCARLGGHAAAAAASLFASRGKTIIPAR